MAGSQSSLGSNDWLSSLCRCSLLCIVLGTLLLSDIALATEDPTTTPQQKRDKRNVSTGLTNDHLTAILAQFNNGGDTDLLQYTPAAPSPEDVNCYVEVPVTRRVGGRCVPLGTHTMGCQAGIYLAFSSECQANFQTSRSSSETTQQQTSSSTSRTGPVLARLRSGRGRHSLFRRRRQPRGEPTE